MGLVGTDSLPASYSQYTVEQEGTSTSLIKKEEPYHLRPDEIKREAFDLQPIQVKDEKPSIPQWLEQKQRPSQAAGCKEEQQHHPFGVLSTSQGESIVKHLKFQGEYLSLLLASEAAILLQYFINTDSCTCSALQENSTSLSSEAKKRSRTSNDSLVPAKSKAEHMEKMNLSAKDLLGNLRTELSPSQYKLVIGALSAYRYGGLHT